jgi:hypothetical protein
MSEPRSHLCTPRPNRSTKFSSVPKKLRVPPDSPVQSKLLYEFTSNLNEKAALIQHIQEILKYTLADHLRHPGEEAVGVRVISRPHDLVWTDIVGQGRDASLDRLERDPEVALEQFARPRLGAGRSSQGAIRPPPDSRKAMWILGWARTRRPRPHASLPASFSHRVRDVARCGARDAHS